MDISHAFISVVCGILVVFTILEQIVVLYVTYQEKILWKAGHNYIISLAAAGLYMTIRDRPFFIPSIFYRLKVLWAVTYTTTMQPYLSHFVLYKSMAPSLTWNYVSHPSIYSITLFIQTILGDDSHSQKWQKAQFSIAQYIVGGFVINMMKFEAIQLLHVCSMDATIIMCQLWRHSIHRYNKSEIFSLLIHVVASIEAIVTP